MRARVKTTHEGRRYGARWILSWLETFPGTTWQDRWQVSPANALGFRWVDQVMAWMSEHGEKPREEGLRSGLLCLLVADVIRPDLEFLLKIVRSKYWREAVVQHRDPAGFARIEESADPVLLASRLGLLACSQIATIVVAKGGGVADVTVGDCLELRHVELQILGRGGDSRSLFYSLLKDMGQFPDDAPTTLRAVTLFSGQLTVDQLVDRYRLQCQPVRDLIVDYLAERQPALDYATFEDLARVLALHFWKNLEDLQPGIDSLHLDRGLIAAWKDRVRKSLVAGFQTAGWSRGAVPGPAMPRCWGGSGPSTSTSPSGLWKIRLAGVPGRRPVRSAPPRSPTRRTTRGAKRGWTSAPGSGCRCCPP
ncbi:hypothetical protein ABZW11_21035 [Nonomuraea sp. NPDC004580]|uniref:hypothetical protein n=1 Tax=Nonomuraea sp. NPDC004580 TaxID=3154552 RepID=UPI0033AF81C3